MKQNTWNTAQKSGEKQDNANVTPDNEVNAYVKAQKTKYFENKTNKKKSGKKHCG